MRKESVSPTAMPNAINKEGDDENMGKRRLPRIVVVGGGTGLSVMLRGLKQMPLDITALVTVSDDGGSSGILRSEFQMPPPGDIRNVLIALADTEPRLAEMLDYRFTIGNGLAGHSLGNLILAAMSDLTGDFVTGVKELSKVLAVRGRVLPSTSEAVVLKAIMADGSIVTGESQIPKSLKKIKQVLIEPADVKPLDEAVEAIAAADAILIGPGSLYTSLIPSLLVPGLRDTIVQAKALKIFVCNVMTQPGETDNYTVSDHLQAIYDHVGHRLFDVVIVNDGVIPKPFRDNYSAQGAQIVRFDSKQLTQEGYRVIADQLVMANKYLRHDTKKLSEHIYNLVAGSTL